MPNVIYVISYDIRDDKRRLKVMKHLKRYCMHAQLSVFECKLSKSLLEKLKVELKLLADGDGDSVNIYEIKKPPTRVVGEKKFDDESGWVI